MEVQIKIDRTTLPKDNSKVEFTTNKSETYTGIFCEGDDLFIVSSRNWWLSFDVSSWKYIT